MPNVAFTVHAKQPQKKGESNFKILKHNSLLRPNSTSPRTSTRFEELLILTHKNNSIIAHKETNINIGSKCYNKRLKYISSQSVRVKEKNSISLLAKALYYVEEL